MRVVPLLEVTGLNRSCTYVDHYHDSAILKYDAIPMIVAWLDLMPFIT